MKQEPNKTAPWHHRLLGTIFAGFVTTLSLLPAWLAYAFADVLAAVLVLVTYSTRRGTTQKRRGFYYNTRLVFRGTLSPRQRRRLLWRWARHMSHLGVDLCRMPKITGDNLRDSCDMSDLEGAQSFFDRGKGLVATSGHIGVYEYTSHLITLCGMQVVTIFRPSPIEPITDVLNKIRSSGGQTMVERSGGIRSMLRALAKGQVTGLVIDISAKDSELHVPFLGTNAATNKTAGILHLRTGAPIVVMTTQRTGRQRYKLHLWDAFDHPPTSNRDSDITAIAKRINEALSRAVREYPEQWFWDSRRYRGRPKGEVAEPDGLPPQINPEQASIAVEKL